MQHGLYTTYINKACRCLECKKANADFARARRKVIAYGRGELFVPVEPARQHLLWLQSKGWSVGRLAEASGVGRHNITSALYGQYKTISKLTAGRILALDDAPERNLRSLDSRGARRRCEALQAIGFSLNFQANYMGIKIQNLFQIVNRDTCHPETIDRIAKMYDALAWTRPQPINQQEKAGMARAINKAKKFGYTPPAGWDDIDRDEAPVKVARDPDFVDPLKLEIRLNGGKVRFNQAESFAATHELAKMGYNQLEIANLLFITQTAVQKRLARSVLE